MTQSGTATATIVFTDVVDSTGHRARLGDAASGALFRDHRRQVTDVVVAHRGRVIKTMGDGVMATFDAASDAVAGAIAMQQAIAVSTPKLGLKVGIVAGDVSWDAGDAFGLPVAAAARLSARASGGQILASHVVRWLDGDRAGAGYRSLGPFELQGLSEPVEVFEVEWAPLATSADAMVSVPLPAQLSVGSRFRFVGRAAEWTTLDAAWSSVRRGGRRIALVGGEAGAGKTRLATELARSCHDAGAVVLFGGCDRELALPYQPWVQALDHLVRSLPPDVLTSTDALDPSDLAVLLPRAERLLPGSPRPVPSDPEADRVRMFDAVDGLLAEVGRRAPVVLVLDDLHWAGRPTLALLRHLAHWGEAERVLVIGTFRDTGDEVTEPLATCLADLRRLDGITRLRLGGLDEPSVERLVAATIGQELDAGLRGLAATLTRRTGGNAFFVGELWDHLVSIGAVHRADGRWSVRGELPETAVPDSVREVVADRVAKLPAEAKAMLELVAAAGHHAELRVLLLAAKRTTSDQVRPTRAERSASDQVRPASAKGSASDAHAARAEGSASDEAHAARGGSAANDEPAMKTEPAIGTALDELVAAGVLVSVDDTAPGYQFGHALVRDTVEARVAPLARARLHLRIAEALESVYEADRRPVLAELAQQFAAAAALAGADKAVYYCRRAAAQAMRLAAYAEAISHLETALALVVPGCRAHAELLLDRGRAELRDGRYVESMQSCAGAFEAANDLGLDELAAQAAIGFEQAVHMPGLPGGPAVDMLEQAMAMVGDDDEGLRARLEASLARAYSHAGRTEDAVTQIDRALALARGSGDVDTLGAALEAALISTFDPVRLVELSQELRVLAARSSDPWHELYATSNGLRAAVALGDLDRAAELLAAHRAASERGRYPAFMFISHAFDVVLALAAGRFAEAEEAAERAHLLGSAGNTPFDAGVYGLQMFAIRREQGRLAEVAPVLRLVASAQGDQPLWRPGLAALYAELGLVDDARRQLEALAPNAFAAIPRDAVWPACAAFLAEVCLLLGDARHAAVLYEQLGSFVGLNLMVGMTICFGPADRLLGGLAALTGRVEAAEQHFGTALALAERSRSPVWAAHVQQDWAELLARVGDHDRAGLLAAQAHHTATALGMAALAQRRLPGVSGQRACRDPSAAARPAGLSSREVEVLQLVAAGRSNRAIGAELHISTNTAANHVRAILQKTGTANRAEAAAFAARNGLLPGDPPVERGRP